MILLDGKRISAEIQEELGQKVSKLKSEGKKIPHLAAVLVGNNAASETYVAAKVKACEKIGFGSSLIRKDVSIPEEELLTIIKELNDNSNISGILIQLPLPQHIHSEKITDAMNPRKDVDGFHPVNVGRMVKGLPCHLPATPFGILTLLERYKIETSGKHCVVIGRSDIVGTPMSILMSRNNYPGNCTVTICHRKTKNLQEITLQADILIAAIGKPEFVKADMVRNEAVVVDVGIHRIEDATKKSGFRLVGDVHFESIAPKCSYITPVPGGVGPMTIAALLMNTMNSVNLVY